MNRAPPRRVRSAFDLSRLLGRGLAAHDAFRAAAAVTFWLFLSLVPLLVFVGFVVGQVARRRGVHALIDPILQVIPAASEAIVRNELERLAGGSSAPIAPVSMLGYLWTASAGLHNLMDVFEGVAQVPRRAYWKKRAISLGWVILSLAAACALSISLVSIDAALRAAWSASGTPPGTANPAPGSAQPEPSSSHPAPSSSHALPISPHSAPNSPHEARGSEGESSRGKSAENTHQSRAPQRRRATGARSSGASASGAGGSGVGVPEAGGTAPGSPAGAASADDVVPESATPEEAPSTVPSPTPRQRPLHTTLGRLFAAGALLCVATAFLAGFYRFAIERPSRARRRVWPGALAAMFCFLAVSGSFSAYAKSIGDYALYYGGLAAVAVLLVWLYLSTLSLIVGAEVNALLEGRIASLPPQPPARAPQARERYRP